MGAAGIDRAGLRFLPDRRFAGQGKCRPSRESMSPFLSKASTISIYVMDGAPLLVCCEVLEHLEEPKRGAGEASVGSAAICHCQRATRASLGNPQYGQRQVLEEPRQHSRAPSAVE